MGILEAIQTSYPEEEQRKSGLEEEDQEEEEEDRGRGGMNTRASCDCGQHTV